eukprot:g26032.t1
MTPWYGTTAILLAAQLNKKYALPLKVIECLVAHFCAFASEGHVLPLVWHRALLIFVQTLGHQQGACIFGRYKFDLSADQKRRIKDARRPKGHLVLRLPERVATRDSKELLRVHHHESVAPEIRRELAAKPEEVPAKDFDRAVQVLFSPPGPSISPAVREQATSWSSIQKLLIRSRVPVEFPFEVILHSMLSLPQDARLELRSKVLSWLREVAATKQEDAAVAWRSGKYGMLHSTCLSITEDACIWCYCIPCAAMQEALQVDYVGDPLSAPLTASAPPDPPRQLQMVGQVVRVDGRQAFLQVQ